MGNGPPTRRAQHDGPVDLGSPDRRGHAIPVADAVPATIGFAINFWAWALLSPLGPVFRDNGTLGALSEWRVSLIVAVPVIVGSLGRIPVGALTDKYGGREMVIVVATVVPVLFIGFYGQSN